MSTLQVNTLQNTDGQEVYTAKAWVNFNGTGTVAIRAAGNISSITDNGVGIYTLNFTNNLPNTNYSFVGTSLGNTGPTIICLGGPRATGPNDKTTSTAQVRAFSTSDQLVDSVDIAIVILG